MNFSKLIINNVLRSTRTYGGYFLSSSFSVFVFFIFSMLTFHPQLKNGLGGYTSNISNFATVGMFVSQFLIILLSFVFLWYSFGVFAKARKRDLSLYMTLGMRPNDLRRLLFSENLLIGFGAIFTGISFGLIFMKFILMVIQNSLGLRQGLDFYFPTIGILLTFAVYLLLFLLVSAFLTFKIEIGNLTELAKSNEKPEPLPVVKPLYVALAFIFLALGYGSLIFFVKTNASVLPLLICVLATVIGTFLFFNQVSVYYYFWQQKRPNYWRGKNLLLTSQGIYRAKENANLYALITCTAAVALVGVSVTATFGSTEANNRNNLPAAYIIDNSTVLKNGTVENTAVFHLGEQIAQKITDAGHEVTYENIVTRPFSYLNEASDQTFYLNGITVSDYNRMARQMGLQQIELQKQKILIGVSSPKEVEEQKDMSRTTQKIFVWLDEPLATPENAFQLQHVPIFFRLTSYNQFAIVPDNFFEHPALKDSTNSHAQFFQLINFEDWQRDPELNDDILQYLETLQTDAWEKNDALHTKFEEGKIDEETYSQQAEENYQNMFSYSSLYQNWREKRQANGFILMIGFLIGGVFFIFTASILYFRLFGDLDKEAQYHRHLYNIGLRPKIRNQIVIRQLLTMYFLPMIFATIHSAVAFWGVIYLVEINLWHYFWVIIAIYFVLQLLLFGFSCWRYLTNLELKINENN